MRGADRRMRGFDQRRLAHAARAPQQRVVRRQAAREALGVLDQKIAHPIDAFEQRHLDPVDARDRGEALPFGMPDKGVGGRKIGLCRRRRRQPFQRVGDPLKDAVGAAYRGDKLRSFRAAVRFVRPLFAEALRLVLVPCLHRFAPSLSGAAESPRKRA